MQAIRLPLRVVNLFRMCIIPPVTVTAGTHLIYPQTDGGLTQPPASLSQESAGTESGTSHRKVAALPTELSWPDNYNCSVDINQ